MNKHLSLCLSQKFNSSRIKRGWRLFTFICLADLLLSTALACGKTSPSQSASSQTISTQTTVPQTTSTLTLSPAIRLPVEFTPGDNTRSLVYAGVKRDYILHIPTDFDNSSPVALVLAFHGVGLDAHEMIRISGFNIQSDASGFIVVYPEGLGATKSWNGGHCCGAAAKNDVDDVGFVRTLIGDISITFKIDPKRIYATGFSNGAILTYRLACELSDLLAAVGPVSATQVVEDMQACRPSRQIPLIHFHGTDDDPNPYYGGETLAGFRFISVDEAIQFWVEFNGCPDKPQTIESGNIRNDIYAPCASGSAVELYTISDGKHAWPGGEAVNQAMGEPNTEISATSLLWEFFSSHPMP